ncbi:MAG TPA: DNA recombination/repair protein RecA, partial [Trueperaceae bacterium]
MNEDRKRALDTAVSQIERQFGKGAIMRLGGGPSQLVGAGVISTGSLSVDLALGVGGLPRGRVVEVYGPESGGKTTLALHVVAEAQRGGGVAAFVDAEH